MRKSAAVVLALVLLSSGVASAQGADSLVVPVDSVTRTEPLPFTSASRVDTLSTGFHSSKSPGLAMLFSAVLPGAGQAYNASYWKVPVVLGFGIYFASSWLHNNRLFREYRDRYKASTAVSPGGDGNLLSYREFYRDQRDTFAWYFAILYFINIADAYVDASLYDFNVGDDLSIRLMPAPTGMALRVSF
jgi:hypothetical protein